MEIIFEKGFAITRNEKKQYDGKCVEQNTIRFFELVEKFGCEHFNLITVIQPMGQITKEFRDTAKFKFHKDIAFHLLIHNKKLNTVIDVSNGKIMMMGYEKYIMLFHHLGKKYHLFPHTLEDIQQSFTAQNDKKIHPKIITYNLIMEFLENFWTLVETMDVKQFFDY